MLPACSRPSCSVPGTQGHGAPGRQGPVMSCGQPKAAQVLGGVQGPQGARQQESAGAGLEPQELEQHGGASPLGHPSLWSLPPSAASLLRRWVQVPHSLTAQQTCTERLRCASLERHPRPGGPHPGPSRHTASEGRRQSLQGDRTAGACRQPGKSPGRHKGQALRSQPDHKRAGLGGLATPFAAHPTSGFSSMCRAQ